MTFDKAAASFWAALTGKDYVEPANPNMHMLLVDGQSLSLGFNGTWTERNDLNRAGNGVWMLAGMQRSDNAESTIQGPQTFSYNEAVSATGVKYAYTGGNLPMCFHIATALRMRREKMGLPNPQILTTAHGVSGQAITEFDDDSPSVTGSLGKTIHDNRGFWMEQAVAQLGSPMVVPYAMMIQGEANANDAAGVYRDAAAISFSDWLGQIGDITGGIALPVTTQIGSYIDSDVAVKTYNVCIEQVEIVESLGGLVLAPWYAKITGDNNIHPDATGYLEQADLLAYYLCEHEAGRTIPPFRPLSQTLIGNQIVLDMNLRAGETLDFDTSGKYDPYGGHCPDNGFQVTGAVITATSISPDGRSVVIDCDAAPTAWDYAMQFGDYTADAVSGKNYGTHRGLLRKTARVHSVYGDASDQYQWALSWRGSFV